MDKAMIAEHLTLAERHVAEGERHIERQRETIRELERDGHDLTAAMARVRSRLYRVRERHAAAKSF
jgi:hypothetical protein